MCEALLQTLLIFGTRSGSKNFLEKARSRLRLNALILDRPYKNVRMEQLVYSEGKIQGRPKFESPGVTKNSTRPWTFVWLSSKW